ncbi:TetR/AcrR family transcriptional regulator [Arthrobacter sp. UYEF20]|uniref:TetR/AcrR family transcriptional regulator n=1 Tax=Arthrobacter sp. UYEF20 TaxID=1756363 RepID=UPI00339A47D9
MLTEEATASARQEELLELAYAYILEHGLTDLSLRPLAAEIGSSPRVLLYLFGNKEGLIRALLAIARAEELALLERLRATSVDDANRIGIIAGELWSWLSAAEHRGLLVLWVEGYARSLAAADGPWAGFARATVNDWLTLLADAQPAAERVTSHAENQRTLILGMLRGALMDLLATGDLERTTAAVNAQLTHLHVA